MVMGSATVDRALVFVFTVPGRTGLDTGGGRLYTGPCADPVDDCHC